MLKDYFRLAVKSLGQRKLRSWLTMIGIVLGIAMVVGLLSLGQGMQKAIEEHFFQLGADKLQVIVKGPNTGPPGSNSNVQLTETDLDVIKRATGVKLAAGRLVEPIRVEFNDVERFLYIASLPEDEDERALVSQIANVEAEDIIAGRLLKSSDRWRIMMSEDYVNNPRFDGKALSVGDVVLINGQPVEVTGVFQKTGNPFVDLSFVMNEEPIRDLLSIPEKYGVIAAQVDTQAEISRIASNIEKDLRKHRDVDEGDEDFEVNTAEDVLDTFSQVLGIVTGVLVGIAGISLLVGGIGIMNTMYTAVLQRKREIGIMKAIGARNGDILIIFLFEAGMLGLVGGVIGVIIGMTLSKLVEIVALLALGTLLIKANFSLYLIFGSIFFSFAVGAISGVVPAMQAARMEPVEALQE